MSKKTIYFMFGATTVVLLAVLLYLTPQMFESFKNVAEQSEEMVPELALADIHVNNLTADYVDMEVTVTMENTLPLGLQIDRLFYRIGIAGSEVMKTTYPDPIAIRPAAITSISLPLTIYYERLQSVLDGMEDAGADSAEYTIHASMLTDETVIPARIDLSFSQKLPLIRIPEIEITELELANVDLPEAIVNVQTVIVNNNPFSFGFENLNYSFQLEEHEAIEGQLTEPVTFPAQGQTSFIIPVEINVEEAGEGILELIQEGGDVQYHLGLVTELISDMEVLEGSEMNVTVSGTIEELTGVVN